jgi:hypothetical protein
LVLRKDAMEDSLVSLYLALPSLDREQILCSSSHWNSWR